MSQTIRAIYTEGRLNLLDPVNLPEGQEIRVLILSPHERLRTALGDLVAEAASPPDKAIDEQALAGEIEAAFQNQPPLSETLLDERRHGP